MYLCTWEGSTGQGQNATARGIIMGFRYGLDGIGIWKFLNVVRVINLSINQ